MFDDPAKRRAWFWGGVVVALVAVLVAGIVCDSSPGPAPSGGGSTRARLAGAASGGPSDAASRRAKRRHAALRRRRAARRRAAARRHQRPTRPASGGIPISRCDWRSGAACPAAPGPGSCHVRGALQDPGCTPGALNPAVTQATISRTICVSGYTDRVRPPTSYTTPLKLRLMAAYGLAGQSTSRFELDHLVSLELGGAPSDPRNLFPEAYAPPPGSAQKDVLENRLHDAVCSGAMSLATAQREIVHWVKYYSGPASGGLPSQANAGGARPAPRSSRPAPGGRCDPDYSGACLDPRASDYDCAGGGGDGPRFVQGPVRVVGRDRFLLDSDGDGLGCE